MNWSQSKNGTHITQKEGYTYEVFDSGKWDLQKRKNKKGIEATATHEKTRETVSLGLFDSIEEAKNIAAFVARSGQPIDFSVPPKFAY